MKHRSSIAAFATASALLAPQANIRGESAEVLIKKGDVFYEKLQAPQALGFYLPAEKLDPNNVGLLVKIAREYRHLMSDATRTEDKVKLGRIAIGYSKRAAGLAPEEPETQLAMAISYGKVLPFVGNKERLETSRLIKEAAEKVVALDPRNDLGWHVLGRWHLTIADVSGVKRALANVIYGKLPAATNEEAVNCFQKAIALNPKRLMHYIELGRTYGQMGRPADARKFIEKGLAMQETEKDDPETKQKGRDILKKL
jgi:tetratricopeptide (TPR) repeat protein